MRKYIKFLQFVPHVFKLLMLFMMIPPFRIINSYYTLKSLHDICISKIVFISTYRVQKEIINLINFSFDVGKTIDTIVMNPPFGTRRKGADMDFLSMALKVESFFIMANAYLLLQLILVLFIYHLFRLLLEQFIPCIRHQQEMWVCLSLLFAASIIENWSLYVNS